MPREKVERNAVGESGLDRPYETIFWGMGARRVLLLRFNTRRVNKKRSFASARAALWTGTGCCCCFYGEREHVPAFIEDQNSSPKGNKKESWEREIPSIVIEGLAQWDVFAPRCLFVNFLDVRLLIFGGVKLTDPTRSFERANPDF